MYLRKQQYRPANRSHTSPWAPMGRSSIWNSYGLSYNTDLAIYVTSYQLCRARPSYITHPLSDIRTRIYWDRLCPAWTMQMYPTHLILSPLPKAHICFLSLCREILAFLHYSEQKYSYDSGKCNMETTQIDHYRWFVIQFLPAHSYKRNIEIS